MKELKGYIKELLSLVNTAELSAEQINRMKDLVCFLSEKKKKQKSILVSKDVNLRMKAKSLGMEAEDYITDKVTNVDIFDKEQATYIYNVWNS